MYLCKSAKTSSRINALKWLGKSAVNNRCGDLLLFVSRDREMAEAAVALCMPSRYEIIVSTRKPLDSSNSSNMLCLIKMCEYH